MSKSILIHGLYSLQTYCYIPGTQGQAGLDDFHDSVYTRKYRPVRGAASRLHVQVVNLGITLTLIIAYL